MSKPLITCKYMVQDIPESCETDADLVTLGTIQRYHGVIYHHHVVGSESMECSWGFSHEELGAGEHWKCFVRCEIAEKVGRNPSVFCYTSWSAGGKSQGRDSVVRVGCSGAKCDIGSKGGVDSDNDLKICVRLMDLMHLPPGIV